MQCKRKLTTNLLMTLMCLMTILLAACGNVIGFSKSALNVPPATPNGTPKAPEAQQVYHFPMVGTDLDIKTFDPALAQDVNSTQAISMVFNGMVRVDDNLQVQPELAQSWNQSSDGLQWTFHLRPNLTFSDSTPLTSQDVAYSIDRALQHTLNSPASPTYLGLIQDADKLYAGQIKTIIGDSVLTPDANTVVLKLVKKAAYFLQALTYPTSYVVEKKVIDRWGTNWTDHLADNSGQGGAGPFKVSQYLHKQEIDFVPNPYYYNLKPLLNVVFSFIATQDIAYQSYQNGQLDFTPVPPGRLNEANQTNEFSKTPLLTMNYFAMNFLAKPFDNLYIRQAFALSIQRETLNNTIYGGSRIPTYHIVPYGMLGYNANLVGPAGVKDSRGNFSVALQRLQVGLQQEGLANVSQLPPIKLTYAKDPTTDKLMTAVTQMWQSVLGVSVILNPVDFNTLLAQLPKTIGNAQGLQMWYIAWSADYPDPQDWTTLQFDKGSLQNFMNYGQNNTADALPEQSVQQELEQADAQTDPATRLVLYNQAEQQLINQVAWIPMFQRQYLLLQRPYVRGFGINSLQIIPPTDWADVYIAVH